MNPIPPVTKVLLWAIGIAFLLQQLNPEIATVYFALWPFGEVRSEGQVYNLFQPWQLVTYAFLHVRRRRNGAELARRVRVGVDHHL